MCLSYIKPIKKYNAILFGDIVYVNVVIIFIYLVKVSDGCTNKIYIFYFIIKESFHLDQI